MELNDWLEVGWIAGEALLGNDMLADIVALGRARPEEESVLER